MHRYFTVLLGLLAGACAAPPMPAPAVPKPLPPASMPAPESALVDWRDLPLTQGNWVYRPGAPGSTAFFGAPGQNAELMLHCDRAAHRVILSRKGAATKSRSLVVRTSSMVRTLATQPSGASPAYMTTALAPLDDVLDAMAFSRGRFVLEQAGLPNLVVPAWAEIGRVAEDCR